MSGWVTTIHGLLITDRVLQFSHRTRASSELFICEGAMFNGSADYRKLTGTCVEQSFPNLMHVNYDDPFFQVAASFSSTRSKKALYTALLRRCLCQTDMVSIS